MGKLVCHRVHDAVIFLGEEDSISIEEPCTETKVDHACGKDRVDESASPAVTNDGK